MGEFDAIRPYDDSEVPAVLARLLGDKAFLDILTHFRFPRFAGALGWALKPLIAHRSVSYTHLTLPTNREV